MRPREDAAVGVDAKDSGEHRAVDVAKALQAWIGRFLSAAQRQVGAEAPVGIAVEIEAESAEAEENRPVGELHDRHDARAGALAPLEARRDADSSTERCAQP